MLLLWDGKPKIENRKTKGYKRSPRHEDWAELIIRINEIISNFNNIELILGPQGEGVSLKTRIGYFVCPEIIGNHSITGLGFKPKSILFWVSKNAGLQTHFCDCQGMVDDSGNQNCMTWAGVWSNIFRGDARTDLCMYTINSAGNSQVTGSLVSMDNDGFTINFTDINSLYIIRWQAIG